MNVYSHCQKCELLIPFASCYSSLNFMCIVYQKYYSYNNIYYSDMVFKHKPHKTAICKNLSSWIK